MRLNRTGNNKIIKKILFVELIFIFSITSSFLILTFLRGEEEKNDSLDRQKYLFNNFRILKFFLNLDLENGANVSEAEAAEINHPLITNIVKLKTAETLFEERKRSRIPGLLQDLDTEYGFIALRKRELYLKYLYSTKRYQDFITYFDSSPVNHSDNPDKINLETQFLLINSLMKTNNKGRALNIFKQLFKNNDMKHFRKSIPRQELTKFLSQLTYDDWYKKFYFLVKNNQFREFVTEKKYINAPTLTRLIDAEFNYRRKQYTRASKLLEKVDSKRLVNHKKKLIIKMNLRQENYDNILEKVDELKKDKEIYAELLLDCASILLIKGETELSARLFAKYLDSGIRDNPEGYKILWVSAWIHYRNNNIEKAIQFFKKGSDSRFFAYKIANSYWLHRLTGNGLKNIEDHPFSYYFTKIAVNKAVNKNRSSKNFLHFINGKPGSRLPGIIADLKLLLKTNLIEECFDYIDWAKRDERLSPVDTNILKIIESLIYLKQQNFYKAFICFKENFPAYTRIVLPGSLCQIYTPVRYKGLIDKYAKLYDLDNMLLLALIREETMFKADAVSPAKANGLMQLLYSTARQMAAGEGIKIRRWDLYKPEINIRLGTKYFRFLLDKYDGQVHLALAAYNAGDQRVDQWLQEFGHVGADEFIEMIPFSDTRSYVKNIFRNHYYYKYYYE